MNTLVKLSTELMVLYYTHPKHNYGKEFFQHFFRDFIYMCKD